jgi:hypothetical protein
MLRRLDAVVGMVKESQLGLSLRIKTGRMKIPARTKV